MSHTNKRYRSEEISPGIEKIMNSIWKYCKGSSVGPFGVLQGCLYHCLYQYWLLWGFVGLPFICSTILCECVNAAYFFWHEFQMLIEWPFYCCCTFYLPRKLSQIVPFPAKLGSAYLDHGPALWELASPVKAWCPGAYPTPWDSHTPMISNMLLAVLATHRIFRDLFLIFHVLSWIIIWAILCRNWRMSWNSRVPMFELCQNLLKYSYVYSFWVVERI